MFSLFSPANHRLLFLGGVVAALAFVPAEAKEVRAGSLLITGAWSRPTPKGAPAGIGYVTVRNVGSRTDRLLGASSPSAARTELHDMSFKDGVMQMRPVEGGIVIPAGRTVRLQPSGHHIMLIGPKRPFAIGRTVPITLRIEHAGQVQVAFDVRMAPGQANGTQRP